MRKSTKGCIITVEIFLFLNNSRKQKHIKIIAWCFNNVIGAFFFILAKHNHCHNNDSKRSNYLINLKLFLSLNFFSSFSSFVILNLAAASHFSSYDKNVKYERNTSLKLKCEKNFLLLGKQKIAIIMNLLKDFILNALRSLLAKQKGKLRNSLS